MGKRTPIQNAPPKSLRATQGQGSREWSIWCVGWVGSVVRKGENSQSWREGGESWQGRPMKVDRDRRGVEGIYSSSMIEHG